MESQNYIGHRARIKERLLKSTIGSLQDYELMELLLCLALPRKDTKDLAKFLVGRYGSFAKAISAEENDLLEIKGIGKNVLAAFLLVKESVIKLTKEEISNMPVISSWQALLKHIRAIIGHIKKEAFIVVYLNNQNELINEDIKIDGTIDQIAVYPREIAKRALFLNASAIILCHNHPSGNVQPSKTDIEMTNNIKLSLEPFRIKVHDHVIVSSRGFFSFKTEGLL